MSESAQADIGDLWQIYQNTKAQLEATVTLKNAVMVAMTDLLNGNTPDLTSLSNSGDAGSESYSMVSLQARFDSLTAAEERLTKLMREQRQLAIAARPGWGVRRIPNGNLRRFW